MLVSLRTCIFVIVFKCHEVRVLRIKQSISSLIIKNYLYAETIELIVIKLKISVFLYLVM